MKNVIKNFQAHSVAARVLICLVCVILCLSLTVTVAWAWYSMVIGSGSNILQIDFWTTVETTETNEETTTVSYLNQFIEDNTEGSEEETTEVAIVETTEATIVETTEALVPETTVATIDETVSE